MKTRGVYEKEPGSEVWWIRYADATGKIRREKAGSKSDALDLVRKRKSDILRGKKLPEKLRATKPQPSSMARVQGSMGGKSFTAPDLRWEPLSAVAENWPLVRP